MAKNDVKSNIKPKVFVFEGPDVSGKTTQLSLVKDNLVSMGYKVSCLKYPMVSKTLVNSTRPSYAKEIYDLLDSNSTDPLSDAIKLSFYNAMNKFDTLCEIKAAINNYDVVLMDRYLISSLIYDYARLSDIIDCKDFDKSGIDVRFCDKVSKIMHCVNQLALSILDAVSIELGIGQNNSIPFEHIIFRKSKAVSALSNMCVNREYTATDDNKNLQNYVEKAYLTLGESNGTITISNNFEDFSEAIRPLNEYLNMCIDCGKGHIVDTDNIAGYNPKIAYDAKDLCEKLSSVTQDITNYIVKEIK